MELDLYQLGLIRPQLLTVYRMHLYCLVGNNLLLDCVQGHLERLDEVSPGDKIAAEMGDDVHWEHMTLSHSCQGEVSQKCVLAAMTKGTGQVLTWSSRKFSSACPLVVNFLGH